MTFLHVNCKGSCLFLVYLMTNASLGDGFCVYCYAQNGFYNVCVVGYLTI